VRIVAKRAKRTGWALEKKMRQTLYLTRSPTKAYFYRSTGSTRKEAQNYFCASRQYQAKGRILITTSSIYGGTTCLLFPDKNRIFGYSPLHGDLISNNATLGAVDIACDKSSPPIEIKRSTSLIVVEAAILSGTYPHVKTAELGYLVELSIAKFEPSFSELWNSRLGFWRLTWGALLSSANGLATELVPALHFTLAAYEFIVRERQRYFNDC